MSDIAIRVQQLSKQYRSADWGSITIPSVTSSWMA